VLAASTHDGEERMIAAAWQKLDTRNMLLVIAPRYPRRGETIQNQLLAAGMNAALRSRDEPVTDRLDVYIADTLGELKGFMREAALVFMGGSLVPRGGQNILEPAQLGKAVVTGPHTFTFEAEVEALQAADALVRVDNADQLTDAFRRLLAEPGRAAEIGENARRLCEARAGIADVYAAELERLGFLSNNHGEHGGHGDKK
jgi:3-deoxy-D-manno-octulosonic-acid transferase